MSRSQIWNLLKLSLSYDSDSIPNLLPWSHSDHNQLISLQKYICQTILYSCAAYGQDGWLPSLFLYILNCDRLLATEFVKDFVKMWIEFNSDCDNFWSDGSHWIAEWFANMWIDFIGNMISFHCFTLVFAKNQVMVYIENIKYYREI